MWKYLDDQKEKEFLLSLHLINGDNEKDILNKIYTISNNIENNYIIHKIKKEMVRQELSMNQLKI